MVSVQGKIKLEGRCHPDYWVVGLHRPKLSITAEQVGTILQVTSEPTLVSWQTGNRALPQAQGLEPWCSCQEKCEKVGTWPGLGLGYEVSEVLCSRCVARAEPHRTPEHTHTTDPSCSQSRQKQTQQPEPGRDVPSSQNAPHCSLLTKLHITLTIKEKSLIHETFGASTKGWIWSWEKKKNPVMASGFLGFTCRHSLPKVSQDLTYSAHAAQYQKYK